MEPLEQIVQMLERLAAAVEATEAAARSTSGLHYSHRIEETLARIEQGVARLLHRGEEARQEWLSISQAATVTDLSAPHIRRAVRRGDLPASNAGTGNRPIWRIARVDLVAWMEKKKGEAAVAVPPRSEMADLIERHLPGLRGRKDSAAR